MVSLTVKMAKIVEPEVIIWRIRHIVMEGVIMPATRTDLVDNYKGFLDDKHPTRVKSYRDLLKNQPASARAEAVIFHFFQANIDDVRVEEDPKKGGVDFRCKTGNTEFVAEVTCLDAEAVARESGLRNEVPENSSSGSYRRITRLLRGKASGKASQMSEYGCPRILVITCEHIDANHLLSSRIAAEFFLTSDTKITIPNPLANPKPGLGLETNLEHSAFFRLDEKTGQLESCRHSISAILLCSVSDYRTLIVGVLHPDPIHKLPIKCLPSIPFVRLKKWPPENSKIQTEWVTHKSLNSNTSDEQILEKPMAFSFYYDENLSKNN